MLSTGNGGAGDNYKITCFAPSATLPIVGQAAPFNGTYIPEGNWNVLAGAQVNGDWSLVVLDGFAPAQFGNVKWWSIGFNTQNNVTYSWNNAATLSCQNCPTPIATPTDTTIYVLTATDRRQLPPYRYCDRKRCQFFPGAHWSDRFSARSRHHDMGMGRCSWRPWI